MGSGYRVVAPVQCIMHIMQIQLLQQTASCREQQFVNQYMPVPIIEFSKEFLNPKFNLQTLRNTAFTCAHALITKARAQMPAAAPLL
jgi:hypothetical protein